MKYKKVRNAVGKAIKKDKLDEERHRINQFKDNKKALYSYVKRKQNSSSS